MTFLWDSDMSLYAEVFTNENLGCKIDLVLFLHEMMNYLGPTANIC